MHSTPAPIIPHEAYVIVGDGRKGIVPCNVGSPMKADLRVCRVFHAPSNPPTREQGTDRPPWVRLRDQRSAIEQTDWHETAKRRFTDDVARELGTIDPVQALLVVAPHGHWPSCGLLCPNAYGGLS